MKNCNINRNNIKLNIRKDFPMLDDDKVYLDSASTSFTPKCVIDAINEYLTKYESNYNRGINDLVLKSTKFLEILLTVSSLISSSSSV